MNSSKALCYAASGVLVDKIQSLSKGLVTEGMAEALLLLS